MLNRAVIAVALEIVGVLAAIVLGGKLGLVLLLVIGTIALALHGRRWFAPRDGDRGAAWSALGGATAGAAALAAAFVLAPALLETATRSVEWSTDPVVRGSAQLAATVALVTVALALATELVFRRWLLDRVAGYLHTRGDPRPAALAAGLLSAAVIEAAVSPSGAGFRLGVAVTSLGAGALYVGAGGRLAAPLAARIVFDVGAILVQALRLTA